MVGARSLKTKLGSHRAPWKQLPGKTQQHSRESDPSSNVPILFIYSLIHFFLFYCRITSKSKILSCLYFSKVMKEIHQHFKVLFFSRFPLFRLLQVDQTFKIERNRTMIYLNVCSNNISFIMFVSLLIYYVEHCLVLFVIFDVPGVGSLNVFRRLLIITLSNMYYILFFNVTFQWRLLGSDMGVLIPATGLITTQSGVHPSCSN